jgi:hypothetical protein
MHNIKKLILSVFIFAFGFATATHAQQVNTLFTKHYRKHRVKRLKSLPSITPQEPSTRSTGMMRMRLSMFSKGKLRCRFAGMLQRLGPGQVFYESPEDVHTVSRNASRTKPAKFVVLFIKNEGAPILTPVH